VVERAADTPPQGSNPELRQVLVVEDDPDLRLLLRTVLQDAGFEVEETDSGPSALEALDGRPVDLVLLDLGLPGLDGHEVLRQLRVGPDALLTHLATHPGVAVSREQFLREVWHSRRPWQDPETVTEHVRRLRAKLTAAGLAEDWITTLRGFGYRFDPPREELAPGTVAP
jgi:DNA-binding response OmpR family regulator